MPLLFWIIFGVAAIMAAIWVAITVVTLVLVPLALIVTPLAMLGGIGFAFVVAIRVLLGDEKRRPRTVTPEDVVTGSVRLVKPRRSTPFGRDRAWPTYLAAQWRYDASAVVDVVSDSLGRVWRRTTPGTAQGGPAPVMLLVLFVPCVAWVMLSAGAVVGLGVVCLVAALSLVVVAAVRGSVVGVLRVVDWGVRTLRRATRGCCPVCYFRISVPMFRCPGCHRMHRDLRPGQLGAWRRRCGCGTALPTTVLRATAEGEISSFCPNCSRPLRRGAATLTDITIPVFGPVSAGKTRLLCAGLLALRDDAASAGAALDFFDEESRAAFENASRVIMSGSDTAKTSAGGLPVAVTAQITKDRRSALIHMFDAAGEFYADREDNSRLEFLDHAQGLVFVVDPFSVPWFRDQLGGDPDGRVAVASPAKSDPEQIYHITARRLRDYGVRTRKQRLAVTVVKADLLGGLSCVDKLRTGAVREWLIEAGLDNLVFSAERDFAEVRYFVVASVAGAGAGTSLSAAAPFRWLIDASGMPLPAGRVKGRVSGV